MGLSYVLLHLFYIRWSLYTTWVLYTIIYVCTKFPTLNGSFYVPRLLYIYIWIHLMYCSTHSTQNDPYIRRVSYVLLWVRLMYTIFLFGSYPAATIYSIIHTIMGPSYVHQLLWSLTTINTSYIGRNTVNQIMWGLTLLPL